MYLTHVFVRISACCLCKQSVIFVCIKDFFWALGFEQGYFPPSTLPAEDHALQFAILVIADVLSYCCTFFNYLTTTYFDAYEESNNIM
jgi:hypothetical protein